MVHGVFYVERKSCEPLSKVISNFEEKKLISHYVNLLFLRKSNVSFIFIIIATNTKQCLIFLKGEIRLFGSNRVFSKKSTRTALKVLKVADSRL